MTKPFEMRGGMPEEDKPRRVTTSGAVVFIQGETQTPLGKAVYIKIARHSLDSEGERYQRMNWEDVWEAFNEIYPDKWAIQVFPPTSDLVNGKHVYHLFVVDHEPTGMNIKRGM